MKTLTKIVALCISMLAFCSCEEDGTKTVVVPGQASDLSASTTTLVLTMDDAEEEAIAFTWTAADFGYPAATEYMLELDKKGDAFGSPKIITFDTTYSVTFTVSEFNEFALAQGLPRDEASELEVRLTAQVSSRVESLHSDVITLTVTPYVSEPPYPTLYMVGDAAEFNWDASKGTPMFRDETDPFQYTFTGSMDQGSLKFLGYLNLWAPMWGTNSQGTVVFRETDSDPDPWAFNVAAGGYYTINLNLLSLTYSITPYDASGATVYSSINLTGDFNGWGAVPMTNTPGNPHAWSVTHTFAADTGLKFRTSDWSAQWGPAVDRDRLYGKAVAAGDNDKVAVVAGTYTILYNDLTGHYVLVKE
jgi:hypothetical protein